MSLDAAAQRRYARQLLLGEVDEAGQVRLLALRFRRAEGCDADAFAVAADYLERAGCAFADDGAPLAIPDEAEVLRFAGKASLRRHAAAVMGAFAAVECIKETLGVGQVSSFPESLRLSTET